MMSSLISGLSVLMSPLVRQNDRFREERALLGLGLSEKVKDKIRRLI